MGRDCQWVEFPVEVKSVLKLDRGHGCTTLKILKITEWYS